MRHKTVQELKEDYKNGNITKARLLKLLPLSPEFARATFVVFILLIFLGIPFLCAMYIKFLIFLYHLI